MSEITAKTISQVKLQLQKVVDKLKALEALSTKGNAAPHSDIEAAKNEISALLTKLEEAPLEQQARTIAKRQRKRKAAKLAKKQKPTKKQPVPQPSLQTPTAHADSTPKPGRAPNSSRQKLHHQLRNYRDAQRFLRTFELLKILHLARGQNVEAARHFSTQFNHLKTVWNNILQENKPQELSAATDKIEDQWNAVYFGPTEKTYYGAERKLSDFQRIRRIWDSYLTHSNKYGSCIPQGWVLPSESVEDRWSQYKCAQNEAVGN